MHKKKAKITFVKSCLVVKTQNGCETSADAKKYVIQEQALRISQLEASIKMKNTVIENLRKLVAGGGKKKRSKRTITQNN